MKLFDRFGFGAQLLDHLAIVGRLAERLRVVINNGQNLRIERLLEFLDGDFLTLRQVCHIQDEVRFAVVLSRCLQQIDEQDVKEIIKRS